MNEPHAATKEEVLAALAVGPRDGLGAAEVRHRRRRHGANALRRIDRRSAWRVLLDQFTGLITWLLVAASVLSFYLGEWREGGAILAVLAINATIGFVTEIRAVRSMEALRLLSAVNARLRRGARVVEIPAEEIVPGDIVLLEGGDIVTADLRLIEAASLQCDESTLTGESVPVTKTDAPMPADSAPAERRNMAFKGTSVTQGSGEGVAVATGMATELGRISALVAAADSGMSPLEKRIDRLGRQLVWVTLALTAVIAAAGVHAGSDVLTMIKTAVALAVAAVPEGLPIVATVALARGMWRMARRHALIERLSAVETLGATTIILTDKTGTLTENRMTVARIELADASVAMDRLPDPDRHRGLAAALRVAVLCANAELARPGDASADDGGRAAGGVGDPMELALLVMGRAGGIERPALLASHPELREEAFSPDTQMMATVHRADGAVLIAVKGAPEAVIDACETILTATGEEAFGAARRQEWRERNAALAEQGLRVLALAMKRAPSADVPPYGGLVFLALVAMIDPPRAEVAEAIAACREAGVRVVMVTGDHLGTATNVAAQLGLIVAGDTGTLDARRLGDIDRLSEDERRRLLETTIFARISPRAKLDLVSLHQQAGAVVAMTGDGVNDAPALRKADIGIAMGRRGTQVAREAADMVLRDDSFASIVAAMRQGRVIFANIRKFVVYLLSCNLSEILVIGGAILIGLPLPLLPLQILYLNLVTDVFPGFALGIGEGEPDVLRRPPRHPREPILTAERWFAVFGYGALIALATLGAFVVALDELAMAPRQAITVAFLTLALAQLWHVFNMRGAAAGPIDNEVTRNPYVWAALVLCIGLLGLAVYLPGMAQVLALSPPDANGWLLAFGASLTPLAIGQAAKSATGRRR